MSMHVHVHVAAKHLLYKWVHSMAHLMLFNVQLQYIVRSFNHHTYKSMLDNYMYVHVHVYQLVSGYIHVYDICLMLGKRTYTVHVYTYVHVHVGCK